MKKSIFIAIFAGLFLCATSLPAQTGGNSQPAKFGFGVTLSSLSEIFSYTNSTAIPAPGFTIPLNISPRFRLEPEVAWTTFSASQEGEEYKDENSGHVVQIGIGFFPMVKKENVILYFGARAGYMASKVKNEDSNPYISNTDEENLSGFYITPATGGEYYFSSHLSAGAEIQLRYSRLSGDNKNDTTKDLKYSNFNLRGMVMVRFYL